WPPFRYERLAHRSEHRLSKSLLDRLGDILSRVLLDEVVRAGKFRQTEVAERPPDPRDRLLGREPEVLHPPHQQNRLVCEALGHSVLKVSQPGPGCEDLPRELG